MTTDRDDRLYDRNFVLALISQMCFVSSNTLMAHYARWIDFLGGDLDVIGWVMGVGPLIGLVFRPWMAQWINRLGARAMWGVGFAIFALASLANLLLTEIGPMIYLVRSLLLVGSAIVFASGLTYVSQTAPDHRRTEAIGIFGVGGFLGMMIGPFVGDLFLSERTYDNFVWLFVTAAIANILPAIGLIFLRPTKSESSSSAERAANHSVKLSQFAATTKRYWPGTVVLIDVVFGVCMAAPFAFVATFIDQHKLAIDGVSVIGLYFLCYSGMGITIRLGSRAIFTRLSDKVVLVAGVFVMGMGMFCYPLVTSQHPWMIVVPALLCGMGHGLMFHTMTSLTIQPFPVAVRGTGSALALMMLDLGTIVGSPILGAIGDAHGYGALFTTIGCLCLIAGGVYVVSCARS